MKKTWRKVLYESQDVPDNYTDMSFLTELRKNVSIRYYTLEQSIVEAGSVTQEIASVVIFSLVFKFLHEEQLSPTLWFAVGGCTTTALYVVYGFMNSSLGEKFEFSQQKAALRSVLIYLSFGYALSPVLKTLTHTISTDTIYATSVGMFILHLFTFDYGIDAAQVSSSLSLNAAIFATVCLASRLKDEWHAFVLLTFSVQMFVLFPTFRKRLKTISYVSWAVVSVIINLLAIGVMTSVSITGSILLSLFIIFVNFLCPYWFVTWQSCKENIYGPWDEAIIKT